MNCATVWLNGREVSFHCKKYKNDMAPENVNRNDIWVRELKGNNIPKFFRDINTGTTLDVFANDALAPYPPYSNGGLAGNLGSVGLFQVGALVVGIDICQDHGGGNDCKVDGQVIGRTSRLKCYLRKHPIFSRGVDLLLVSSFGAGASAADSPVRRGGVIVATDSGGGAQNYGMYVLQTNSKWNYNDAMAGIGDQTLNTMYHCASRAWSTANQGGVALFKKAPQGCGWNEAAPAAGRCYNVFARELTLGTANAPVVPNACAGSKWA
ncbi:hypothetical protein DFJ74DRAFT_682795 [Hyaloraphidium curvatum]|nr:hypothetical protein DFJ74DRAFT_682795 [Hyaloraphidium curvatum]